MSETKLAEEAGLTTTQLRAARSIVHNQRRMANILIAKMLKDQGYSNVSIAKVMDISESSVRVFLSQPKN